MGLYLLHGTTHTSATYFIVTQSYRVTTIFLKDTPPIGTYLPSGPIQTSTYLLHYKWRGGFTKSFQDTLLQGIIFPLGRHITSLSYMGGGFTTIFFKESYLQGRNCPLVQHSPFLTPPFILGRIYFLCLLIGYLPINIIFAYLSLPKTIRMHFGEPLYPSSMTFLSFCVCTNIPLSTHIFLQCTITVYLNFCCSDYG